MEDEKLSLAVYSNDFDYSGKTMDDKALTICLVKNSVGPFCITLGG